MLGTPATPFSDATTTGSAALNQAATPVPITAATTAFRNRPKRLADHELCRTATPLRSTAQTFTFVHDRLRQHLGHRRRHQSSTSPTRSDIAAREDRLDHRRGADHQCHHRRDHAALGNGAVDLSVTSSAPAFAALGFANHHDGRTTGGGTAGTGFVVGNDVATFTSESISGGAVTAYNSAGTPVNLQLRWAKTDSASLGARIRTPGISFYQTDPSATGSQVAWVNAGTNFMFNANGSLSSPTGSAISIPNLTVSGQSLGTVSFNVGSGALTQYASTGGTATVNNIIAERLCRRPASVGRHQQQRPCGRNVLQRAEHRSCLGHAVALQRHQLPASARAAAPMP